MYKFYIYIYRNVIYVYVNVLVLKFKELYFMDENKI